MTLDELINRLQAKRATCAGNLEVNIDLGYGEDFLDIDAIGAQTTCGEIVAIIVKTKPLC
jgi:hypothetical protein